MLNQRWTDGLTPAQIAARLRKPTPRILVKAARKKSEDTYYREQKGIAKRRDSSRCRICGAPANETHHVERRSAFGSKQVEAKHHHSNLLSVCAGLVAKRDGSIPCHQLLTGNVLKATSTTARGTNGPVEILKWDVKSGGFRVLQRKA